MARRNHAVEDSDSLTSLSGSRSSSPLSDETVEVRSTFKTANTTPATSVFGEESASTSTITSTTASAARKSRVVSRESISRAVVTSGKTATSSSASSKSTSKMSIQSKLLKQEEGDKDSDSELSDLAEEAEHASKRSRVDVNSRQSKAVKDSPNGLSNRTSGRRVSNSSGGSAGPVQAPAPVPSSAAAMTRSSSRGKSPEVVVYVKRSSSEASSSSASKKINGNLQNGSRLNGKRTRSSLATSSPIYKDESDVDSDTKDMEEDIDDPDATEEEILPVRRTRIKPRGSLIGAAKFKVESEEEKDDDFMPSGQSIKGESDMKEEKASDTEIITASQLLSKQISRTAAAKSASSPLNGKRRDMLANKDKGKGQKTSAITANAKKTETKTVSKIARRSLEKLKLDIVNGKDKKGKSRKMESSDEDGDSDFVIEASDLSSAESAVETPAGDDSSELSDVEISAELKRIRATSSKKRKRNVGPDGKKLTWWQKNDLALQENHPELRNVWDDLRLIDVVKPVKADQPTGLTMKLLPFQLEGLYWMKEQEAGPWRGGLLADEMGMGKTIQMISLVLSDFKRNEKERTHTLVLAPTVAIMQWRNEFGKFTSGMKVCVWHGGNRTTDRKELLKYDVILTSYAVLESAFRRQNTGYKRKGELIKEESVLHSIDWHRVILDEAHNIKDRSCNTARGAFALKANYKWCLSGTPLQNRVGELYSLIRFIGVDPFAYYYCKNCPCKALHWRFSDKRTCDECGHTPMHHICYWNNEILKPIQKYGAMAGTHGAGAFEKLSLLLARMMLRRTKVDRADDMGLPPRDIVLRADFFTEEEEEFYTSLYSDVKRQFSTYVAADSLLNNYANVFQLLTRMRQTACHPDMVLKGAAAKALLGDGASKTAMSISTCRLCLDEGEDPIMSRCRHVFCRECIRQYLETALEMEPECPVCHLPITIDLSQDTDEELINARQGMLSKIDPGKWRTSTKIEALVEELSKLKTEDHSIKSLVFSQFTSFLDLIARRLQLAGFKVARLQGNMTPEARDRTVKYFMNTTDCTVFLLSLKAGGVALNLTEASRVFIMDPWWNPAAELQAMDRIHRIGQHRPVIVKRLIIENSIESKIVELQKKKENMTGAALGDDDQALGRLTPEDLSFLFVM